MIRAGGRRTWESTDGTCLIEMLVRRRKLSEKCGATAESIIVENSLIWGRWFNLSETCKCAVAAPHVKEQMLSTLFSSSVKVVVIVSRDFNPPDQIQS